MAKMKRRPEAVPPVCPACRRAARLTDGAEIYGVTSPFAARPIWKCDVCGSYVGCHPKSTRPLGTPANAQLRAARQRVHAVLDPLWMKADQCAEYTPEDDKARHVIRQVARVRVYTFLADRLKLKDRKCHTAELSLEQCDLAISYLRDVDYPTIRDWYKARKAAESVSREQITEIASRLSPGPLVVDSLDEELPI